MNYEGSAEKFSYRFFFSIFILVPSVTANIEMTPPMIGLHMAGKISRCRWRLKDVWYLNKIATVSGRLNGIVSFSSARVNVYNIL